MRFSVRSMLTLAFLLLLSTVATGQITATIEPTTPTSADFIAVRLQGSVCRSFASNPVAIQGSTIRIGFVANSPCFSVVRFVNVVVPIGQLPAGNYTVMVLASQISDVDFSFSLVIADSATVEPIPVLSPIALLVLSCSVGALAMFGVRRAPMRAIGSSAIRNSKFILGAILVCGMIGVASPTSAAGLRQPTTLVLLIDANVDPTLSDDLVAAATGQRQDPTLLSQFGNPSHARFLSTERTHAAIAQQLHPNSAARVMSRYLTLTFPVDRADSAVDALEMTLRRRPDVLWVERASTVTFSATTPVDTYFSGGGALNTYQWGMQKLQMPQAWDWHRGHAYVGILDTGIQYLMNQSTGRKEAHPDLKQNFRARFSYDFGGSYRNVGSPTIDDDINEEANDTIGHGTHVAGIIGGTPNNSLGVSGSCWYCSLIVAKISQSSIIDQSQIASPPDQIVLDAMTAVARSGVQVMNFSFQADNPQWTAQQSFCSGSPLATWCTALAVAEENDVVIVNSAANAGLPVVPMNQVAPPGSDPRVISVGATTNANVRADFSHYGQRLDLVAPGSEIVSTFYVDGVWNAGQLVGVNDPYPRCADSISVAPGYGPCSGTSMSAPHVTGLVGLIRSINPLLTRPMTKSVLTSSTNPSYPPYGAGRTDEFGYGIPDAERVVKNALGVVGGKQQVNRLTPLFGLYSSGAANYFYTTVPQMARAAVMGTLQPQPHLPSQSPMTTGTAYYQPVGVPVNRYGRFPGPYCFSPGCSLDPLPRASVYVLSTFRMPLTGPTWSNSDVVPLYRLSWDDPAVSSTEVVHVYTIPGNELMFRNVGFRFDGIEGYIYRCQASPQPPDTVRLYRKFNPSTGTYALVPQGELAAIVAAGYSGNAGDTGGTTCFDAQGHQYIGFAYPNIDADGDGLIDGYEAMLGTCRTINSTKAGVDDWIAVMQYPYQDPGSCAGRIGALVAILND